jgi:hypothetical protein
MHLLLALVTNTPASADVLSAWDQLTEAITNYKVVGVLGLAALAIGVAIAVLKRWQAGGPKPNWWARLPRWGRRAVVTSFGVVAGVIAAIQSGVKPAEAIIIGFSGLLSVTGHELGKRLGIIAPSSSTPAGGAPGTPPPGA